MRKYNDILDSVSSLLPNRGNVRDLMTQLHDGGLIGHRNDRKGLARLMKVMPGDFPRTEIPDDREVEAWASWTEDNLVQPQLGPTVAINADGGRRAGPSLGDDYQWYGLGSKTTLAAATNAFDALTVTDIAGDFDDAILFISTGGGRVRYVNDLLIDDEPVYLGPGDFIEGVLLDIEELGDGPAIGVALGPIKDKVSINYFVELSATDVVCRASILACGRHKAAVTRRPKASPDARSALFGRR